MKNQQILIAEFISTDFISQNGTLNPVPEPMQGNGETEVTRIYIGSPQETTYNLIGKILWEELPESYSDSAIFEYRKLIFEYVFMRYKQVA